jgi:hypothetical protein
VKGFVTDIPNGPEAEQKSERKHKQRIERNGFWSTIQNQQTIFKYDLITISLHGLSGAQTPNKKEERFNSKARAIPKVKDEPKQHQPNSKIICENNVAKIGKITTRQKRAYNETNTRINTHTRPQLEITELRSNLSANHKLISQPCFE